MGDWQQQMRGQPDERRSAVLGAPPADRHQTLAMPRVSRSLALFIALTAGRNLALAKRADRPPLPGGGGHWPIPSCWPDAELQSQALMPWSPPLGPRPPSLSCRGSEGLLRCIRLEQAELG